MTSVIFTGCVNDDDYAIPSLDCVDSAPAATKTVAEIINQKTGGKNPVSKWLMN